MRLSAATIARRAGADTSRYTQNVSSPSRFVLGFIPNSNQPLKLVSSSSKPQRIQVKFMASIQNDPRLAVQAQWKLFFCGLMVTRCAAPAFAKPVRTICLEATANALPAEVKQRLSDYRFSHLGSPRASRNGIAQLRSIAKGIPKNCLLGGAPACLCRTTWDMAGSFWKMHPKGLVS
jgi:hypothetical protein